MLTFEMQEKGDVAEIHFDEEGRELLIRLLLQIKPPWNHEHLMSEAWAGNELDNEPFNKNNTVLNMVNVYLHHPAESE